MGATHGEAREAEALCRSLLHNAAARLQAASRAEPETPSVDYRTGFAAGREAGEMAGLALAVGALTGETPAGLLDQAMAQAAVDSVFPVELHVVDAGEEVR